VERWVDCMCGEEGVPQFSTVIGIMQWDRASRDMVCPESQADHSLLSEVSDVPLVC
jgi:hypothetical protein